MKRRYGVLVSAAVLALQLSGDAAAQVPAVELEELETISALLDANDVEGLRTYLAVRPELLQGGSDLARLLREYMEQSADVAAFVGVWEDAAGVAGDDSDAGPAAGEAPDAGDPVASLY